MNIIALLPFKNEAWALPSYLSSVSKIADQIIALDDQSRDESASVLRDAGARIVRYDFGSEKVVNMSRRRNALLTEGRKAKGTHFIWLDADETFSANFITNARSVISGLRPGQKLAMRWVHAWKDTNSMNTDPVSPFGVIWKDFVVCDDKRSTFEDRFLSEARTPGPHHGLINLPESEGVVIHWQFSRWEITQYKQALYRCLELIEGSRSARRINHTYSITLDRSDLMTGPIPTAWTQGLAIPAVTDGNDTSFYEDQILSLFKTYGIVTFEPLEIWHLPKLRAQFVNDIGRNPKSQRFPAWLVALNKVRHAWKN